MAAAAFGGIQTASALVDCIKICHQTYCYMSNFVHSIKEMGVDVADLEQRYKEEDSRMWTFALAHNLIVDQQHQMSASHLENLPTYWVSVVDARFVQVSKHLKEARELVVRYAGNDNDSALEDIGKPPIHSTATSSHYLLKKSPTESKIIVAAQSLSEERVMTLQKSSFQLKLAWSYHGKKKLDHSINKLERDNDILWNLTAPNVLNSMIDAVSSRISSVEMEMFKSRIARKANDDRYMAARQRYEQRVNEQSEARDCIAKLDQETRDQKLARRLDALCFQEILHTKLPDPRPRTPTTRSLNGEERGVLVEWKEWDENVITRDEVTARVSDIAAILKSPPSSMHNILSCLGFFEDSRSNDRGTKWIGIAYDTTPLGYRPTVRTLRDLLARPKEKYKEVWKPALGDRFRLAHELAKTLLAIHNCD